MTDDDLLDRFLEDAQPEVPPELAERVLAAVRDAELLRQTYWAEVASAARAALLASAAALLISAGSVGFALATSPARAPLAATTESEGERDAQLAQLTVSLEEFEQEAVTELLILGPDAEQEEGR